MSSVIDTIYRGPLPEGTKIIHGDIEDGHRIEYLKNIKYVERHRPLHIEMLHPYTPIPGKKYPLVVYVPGSAWREQRIYAKLPLMVEVAQSGYIVAIVEYRHIDEGKQFPVHVEDTKSAIRFLRAHAEEYGIDVDRIGLWGDSSGGHTALLTAYSKNIEFITADNNNERTDVNCIIDFYGIANLFTMRDYPSACDHIGDDCPEAFLVGGLMENNMDIVEKANVLNYISKEHILPPTLIMHGDGDATVPFYQSIELYDKLRECHQTAELYMVQGAGHGLRFWTPEVMQIAKGFLKAYL